MRRLRCNAQTHADAPAQGKSSGSPDDKLCIAICCLRGYLERVLSCHPEALSAYRQALAKEA